MIYKTFGYGLKNGTKWRFLAKNGKFWQILAKNDKK
jgi:hypothetical protein